MEYNHANQNTYLTENKRYNYSHANLSLAHPLTGAFDELVFRINYQYKTELHERISPYTCPAHFIQCCLIGDTGFDQSGKNKTPG
ncbi:MAG: hypothetical protein IPG07_07630 [Crocinitomicaceae bacterium]|nr:hypothetical protein [Crocinitomicaceae bacterium]